MVQNCHTAKKLNSTSTITLETWNPEDAVFWETRGKSIAYRNLWISLYALLLAFSVWIIWSVVVVNLQGVGFHLSNDQLF